MLPDGANMRSLAFFAEQSAVTSPGRHESAVHDLPADLGELVRVIQQLVVYDVVAPDFYGYRIPKDRQEEIHISTVEHMLDRLFALDSRPLTTPRPVEKRLVGRCHQFMWLLIAALRSRQLPARARCGFGSYFNPPSFEDHWVCEYWHEAEARWILVDAQFDDVWRERLKIDHDVLDVPRNRFLVAGDAWRQCRRGDLDAQKFGIDFVNLRGLWYVAGNIVRDLAALNRVEVRPWDVWGAQPRPNQTLNDTELAWFDELAALTRQPDKSFDQLCKAYSADGRLRVPAVVYNALLNQPEPTPSS
jgi:Transglutaminase-like superfamily